MGHCTGAGPEVPGQAPTGQKVKDTKYGVQADGSGLALLGDKRGVETQPQKPESESESESASLERAPALSWQFSQVWTFDDGRLDSTPSPQ
ncbi:hypothetical protein M419DRAFT_10425 [Trichoderma reesei RUT C-30]|uniref:Uncharacterized protein n=1 Tax=Hypocrea jecorina (strain ATCC 56765 / BCRC 32924 / NRRL 11460 / Rut C-30) TaxID=1344414 RepID=A0A024S3J6_HYPJR|nr:hypothetical protein M419DRAFT_10425 [Trichoderma reesei RUT C-30]